MAITAATRSIRQTKLGPLAAEIRKLADLVNPTDGTPRDFTAEERERWDRINQEYEQNKRQVEIDERAADVESSLADPADPELYEAVRGDYDGRRERKRQQRAQQPRHAREGNSRLDWLAPDISEESKALTLQAWMRVQSGRSLNRDHEEACQQTGFNPNRPDLDINALMPTHHYRAFRSQTGRYLMEQRAAPAQALNANMAGGYLVPEGFVQNLEIALLQYSNIRSVAEVMRTASGQDLPWPSANDTYNKGSILNENATVTTGPTVVFAQTILHAYKYTSNLIPVPVELMEDSAFDLAAVLGELLGIRIARIQNDHMTFGTGIDQPVGITVGASQGVQAASPTAIAFDDLYKLEHAVDPDYRNAAMETGFMFHDQILSFLKRIKDGLGRPLWQASVAGEVPARIDGWPYLINQSMSPTMASGNKTVLFGAFRKYKVREVSQIRLRRLVERFADVDQEAFVMFSRFDAKLLDAGTHPVQYLIH